MKMEMVREIKWGRKWRWGVRWRWKIDRMENEMEMWEEENRDLAMR